MLVLNSTLKSLEIKLAGAVTTTELPFVSSYVDTNQNTFALSGSTEQDGTSNGSTAVTVVTAPGSSTSRKLNFLSVFNVDTVAAIVTIQVNNNGTTRIIWKGTLAVGDTLTYTDGENWKVFDSNGNIKTAMGGILPAANFPALSGDVSTIAGSLVTTIGAAKVTNAMLAGSIAASKLIGTDIATVGTVTAGVWNAGAVTTNGKISTGGASSALEVQSRSGAGSPTLLYNPTGADLRFNTTSGDVVVFGITGTVFFNGLSASGVGDTYICLSTGKEVRTGATCAASTEKIKEDIEQFNLAIPQIKELNPKSYKFKPGFYGERCDLGFLVEELAKTNPLLAFYAEKDEDLGHGKKIYKGDPLAPNISALLTLSVQAIKEQQLIIELLEDRMNTLNDKVYGW